MTEDAVVRVLGLVAEGRLTAEEAAPILDALDASGGTGGGAGRGAADTPQSGLRDAAAGSRREPRVARVQVVEAGRRAVDLRIPLSLGRRALSAIPGLSSAQAAEVDEAVARGLHGPIVDIKDEDGNGVSIVLE